MYEIKFKENAFRELEKFDKGVQIRVISVLERIRNDPFHYAKKLKGTPYFRLRVGDYRVIIDIQDKKMIVLVVDVGHRKNVYSKLKK